MFEDMISKLKHEFGFLNESETEEVNKIETDVINQLDRSSKLDEVDTVTFGLETDDGKIVKVYVNAEQAEEFEKALGEKLGEVDDIEEVLNDLSKDFEIVDVEWPDEANGEEDESDVEDELETDGSEVMNQKVWNKGKSKESVKPAMENLTYGEQVALSLTEASEGNSVESRLTTATQLMIYHAVLELGIPEIALNKSPYKSSIVTAIKERAAQMQKDPDVKAVLKMFVQRAVEGTGGGKSLKGEVKPGDETKELEKNQSHKKDETVEEKPQGSKAPGDEKKDHKKIKEALNLTEGLVADFWDHLNGLLRHVGTPDETEKLFQSTKFKSLVNRSGMMIPKVVKTELRMRLQRMSDAIKGMNGQAGIIESVTPVEAFKLITDLFDLVDPTPNKDLATALVNSQEWKQFMVSARPTMSQKFKGASSQKFKDLLASTEEAKALTTPAAPTKVDVVAETALTEAAEWTYEMDDQDNAVITFEHLKFALNPEELEKAVKAINTKSMIVLLDAEDPKRKITLSPRGVTLVVKKVGDSKTYQMTAEQIEDFMKFAVEAAEGKAQEKVDDEAK